MSPIHDYGSMENRPVEVRNVPATTILLQSERIDELEVRVQELEAALRPFAKLAEQYDERVYPDSPDSQPITTRLGDLRAARRALLPASPTGEEAP